MSIASKILMMLLAVSIASVVATGIVGYISGTNAIRKSVNDNMVQLRESRTSQIEAMFTSLTNTVAVVSHGQTVISAMNDYSQAFADLRASNPEISPADQAALKSYYSSVFAPEMSRETGKEVDPSIYLPTDRAQQYLQARYTVPPAGDWTKAIQVGSAGDPSAWSAVNARLQPYFRDLTERSKLDDLLLIDRGGNVVYSAYKGVDLGTNLINGPLQSSQLADGFAKAMAASSADEVIVTDFGQYAPALGKPVAWVLTPVGSGGSINGVMALQVPVDGINAVMTGDEHWQQQGLGSTGETFLAGPDKTMRSTSRMLITDPARYRSDVVDAGTPASVADRVVARKNPILLQPVGDSATTAALTGKSGVTETKDYLGNKVLAAYGPVDVPGLNWVLVAKIDSDEAFAPVNTFARNLALTTAGIVLVVSLLSVLLARAFARPLRVLNDAARKVSAGDYGVTVGLRSRDELGDLAGSFNDMSRSLETKQALIDKQRDENRELLTTLMPEALADRYQEGETTIIENHRNVSVVFTELAGLDEYTATMPAEDAVRVRSAFADSVESAAQAHGLDRVQALRGGFLASCGLTVPRIDHVDRSVQFALEVQRTVRSLNAQFGTDFTVRAGIDSGSVSAGLVGSKSMVYELWGEALDLAYRVHAATGEPGIFVSQRVRDALSESYAFTAATMDGADQVWSLDAERSHA